MVSSIKQKIARNFYNAIHNGQCDFLRNSKLIYDKNKVLWRVQLPSLSINKCSSEFFKNTQQNLLEDGIVKNVTHIENCGKHSVSLELEVKPLIKDVLESEPTELLHKPSLKKVIVEFSSPNIAKPFHVGHLRSTIIGNYIANVKKKLGHEVIKMNYLGDWGTQFGMIEHGMACEHYTEESLKKNPLEVLLKAYVRGNREAEMSVEVYEKVKKIFSDLEEEKEELVQKWNKYKNITSEELKKVYSRLGVSFDVYSWESEYKRKNADDALKALEEKGVLSVDDKGRKIVTSGDCIMPLVKSDNTTLYLLRDLMALTDRRSKYKFNEMYYVVENGQNAHFNSLFALCSILGFDEQATLRHVKFGRIHGMSTRKGKVVFLKDILDEAKERCYERQISSPTTKVTTNMTDIADILGTSAVMVNDLKRHRRRDYDFSWETALQMNGESGIQLQYCHCRLCNLDANSGARAATECDPEALLEPQALELVLAIAKFEEALLQSDNSLESCVFTTYLFNLIHAINLAFKVLPVKNSDEHLASQRLLLFNRSRQVLCEGIKLLGLKPLKQM